MHIVFLMANNSSVPYFNWFAEKAREYADITFSFVALTSTYPDMISEMSERGCACYWIPFDTTQKARSIPRAILRLYKLFRKIKPDIVHTHLFDDAVPSLIAARLAGIKHRVITKQDTAFHWHYAPKAVKYDRLNNRNATRIVAVSEECRDFIIHYENAPASKITVIHHAIPFQKLTAQSEEVKKTLIEKYGLANRIVIGTIARLIEWKGYRHIIKAASIVVKKYPEAVFLFTGHGEQKPELDELVRSYGLEKNIIFTGWVERSDIPSLYGLMDIYLHAASLEPFGFVIAEAMANGVPVVSTATGAAKDSIIHKQNGYLTRYDDPQALAEGIFYMLDHDRKAIGKAGKETAERMFEFSVMWSRHIELYRKLCLNENADGHESN